MHLAGLADLHAHQLILKAGDEAAAAHLKGVVLGLAAVKGDAVHKALKVQGDGIAVLHGPLHVLETGGALAGVLNLLLYGFLGNGGLVVLGLQALIVAQSDLRVHIALEGDGGNALVAHRKIDDGGSAHHLKLALLRALLERVRGQQLNRVVMEHVLAVHSFDDHAGSLALAEAGHIDLALGLLVAFRDGLLKGLRVNLHLEYGGAVLFLFDVFHDHGVILLTTYPWYIKQNYAADKL